MTKIAGPVTQPSQRFYKKNKQQQLMNKKNTLKSDFTETKLRQKLITFSDFVAMGNISKLWGILTQWKVRRLMQDNFDVMFLR